jgi:hypothetical protein
MPADQQRQIVDTLLSPKDGAGLSILRLGIGSAPDGVGDNPIDRTGESRRPGRAADLPVGRQ